MILSMPMAANESPRNRENKIRMVFRQKVQLALGTLHPALAPQHAAADGNLGLDHVIAGPKGIQLRIQKDPDTVSLVFMQKLPQNRRHTDKCPRQDCDPIQLKAAHPEHGKGNGPKDKGRPQIRLP